MQRFTSKFTVLDKAYIRGELDSVYIELPTGQRSWFAVPIDFSFDKPIYLAGLALYSDLQIHSEEDFVTEYFQSKEGCFVKVCGQVQAITQTLDGYNKAQVECDGLMLWISLSKDVRVTVGDYLELTVLASLSNDEEVISPI